MLLRFFSQVLKKNSTKMQSLIKNKEKSASNKKLMNTKAKKIPVINKEKFINEPISKKGYMCICSLITH